MLFQKPRNPVLFAIGVMYDSEPLLHASKVNRTEFPICSAMNYSQPRDIENIFVEHLADLLPYSILVDNLPVPEKL